jgi:hypothetical protein
MTAPIVRAIATEGPDVYTGMFGGGVAHSGDYGQTWALAVGGLENTFVNAMVAGGGVVYAGTWNGVWSSSDQAATWETAGLQGNGIFALTFDGEALLAGTFGGKVWSSMNGGQSWVEIGSGLPEACVCDVVRLGSSLYAALVGAGVYELPNGGSTWSSMNDGLPNLNSESLAAGGGTLLFGTWSDGLYRWNEGTAEWEASGLGGEAVFSLADTGAELLAGTWGGLHASYDGGYTWSSASDGLKPWLAVRALAVGSQYLYAGLEGGGVWRSEPTVGIGEPVPESAPGADFVVSPNPFRPGATIRFRLDAPAPVKLAVYDVSGRRAASLATETLPAGEHERLWDGTLDGGESAPAGVYWIRLEAGERSWRTKAIRLP